MLREHEPVELSPTGTAVPFDPARLLRGALAEPRRNGLFRRDYIDLIFRSYLDEI